MDQGQQTGFDILFSVLYFGNKYKSFMYLFLSSLQIPLALNISRPHRQPSRGVMWPGSVLAFSILRLVGILRLTSISNFIGPRTSCFPSFALGPLLQKKFFFYESIDDPRIFPVLIIPYSLNLAAC